MTLALVESVMEGDSVTLDSGLTEMKDDDQILWMFGTNNTLIAEINKRDDRIAVYDDVLDGRFRDRLKLDSQTGSLTITNITTEHAGDYKRKSNTVEHHFSFTVYVEISVMEGDSVTLDSGLTDIDYYLIQWRFGTKHTLIAVSNKWYSTINDDVLDRRFRDRLKLDSQTGSLTITNITTEHAGDYKLQTASWKKLSKAFRVSVIDSVHYCLYSGL
ncbi:uncharacterized protein [Chanodichthys erythropterus]|uniref:uncharacterized protein n=1 Tax=Chanodichthys erythropterus TaxID=933992 RepID=UPI00351F3CEE